MNPKSVYCEECVEDIPNDEIYWEEGRMYCGRCGSELESPAVSTDVFEQITTKKLRPIPKFEDDEYEYEDESEFEEDER